MNDFLFPDVGEGIHEGRLVAWKIKEGDTVKQDQVLVAVETDKAIVEIPAPRSGTITKLYYREGDVAKVGTPLLSYGGEPGGSAASPPPPAITPHDEEHDRAPVRGTSAIESSLAPKAPLPHEHEPAAGPVHEVTPVHASQGPVPSTISQILATPSTRKLARELGVDLRLVRGSAEHGRITAEDVRAAAGAAPKQNATPARAAEPSTTAPTLLRTANATSADQSMDRIPYTGRRKAIGDHMMAAHAVPAVTEFAEADVTALVALRERLKATAESSGVKLTYLALFAKACCAALAHHPLLNSRLLEGEIDTLHDVHLGIAVDTPKGLVVPVVREANHKSTIDIAREIQALAQAGRDDKLTLEQVRGSTFSISSIGNFRVQGFTPMLNAPEEAILGIGAIQDKPWIVNGAVQARKVVVLSLTFDHRIIDGIAAAKFLSELVGLCENPDLLILEAA